MCLVAWGKAADTSLQVKVSVAVHRTHSRLEPLTALCTYSPSDMSFVWYPVGHVPRHPYGEKPPSDDQLTATSPAHGGLAVIGSMGEAVGPPEALCAAIHRHSTEILYRESMDKLLGKLRIP